MGKSLDVCYGNEYYKMFFYVVIEILLSDVEEIYGNSMLEVMIYNLFLGVNGVNSIFFECNEGFLEF